MLLGQGSAQHTPGPSFYLDTPSRSGTLCTATYDPLGQSRSTSDHTPRAPLWGSVVGWRKLPVTRPTDSLGSHVVGHPCHAASARSTGHTQPPTCANHPPPPPRGRKQARLRLKVQALNQPDAIAEEALRAINAELNTMASARNQQI